MYAFCSIPKYPGYFWLCFQAGDKVKPGACSVKVIPNAFQMENNVYPDMASLKNGFKLMFKARQQKAAAARNPMNAIPRR